MAAFFMAVLKLEAHAIRVLTDPNKALQSRWFSDTPQLTQAESRLTASFISGCAPAKEKRMK
ncbi:hypothetical protein GCM10009077_02790 [Roseibium denhamense]